MRKGITAASCISTSNKAYWLLIRELHKRKKTWRTCWEIKVIELCDSVYLESSGLSVLVSDELLLRFFPATTGLDGILNRTWVVSSISLNDKIYNACILKTHGPGYIYVLYSFEIWSNTGLVPTGNKGASRPLLCHCQMETYKRLGQTLSAQGSSFNPWRFPVSLGETQPKTPESWYPGAMQGWASPSCSEKKQLLLFVAKANWGGQGLWQH